VYDALLFLSWKFTRTDAAGVGIPRGKRALYASCHALFFAAENYYESLIKLQKKIEESIVNAPPNYNSEQRFKSNLTFCVVVIHN
jgi:hypothetical protein